YRSFSTPNTTTKPLMSKRSKAIATHCYGGCAACSRCENVTEHSDAEPFSSCNPRIERYWLLFAVTKPRPSSSSQTSPVFRNQWNWNFPNSNKPFLTNCLAGHNFPG